MPTPSTPASLLRVSAACLAVALALSAPAQDFSHPDSQPDPSAALVQQANDGSLLRGPSRRAQDPPPPQP